MEAAREYVETAGLAEAAMAKNLADKYFNLAEKESLTNDQKLEMQNLAKALIGTYPKLEEYYNAETGLLDTTRQTVDQLIESRLKEIKLAAVEEKLKEAYKEQADALENLQGAIEDASTAQSTMNDLQDEYQALVDKKEALTRYEEIGRQLENATGDTTDLIEEQQRLADFLTNGGTESFPTFTTLENDIFGAQQDINDFQGTYDGFMNALSSSTFAYDEVQGNIDKFTEMLTSGMKSAAGDGVEGAAEGIDEGKDALSTANKLLAEAGLEGYAEGQDSHSPSKKYMKLAGDSIDGLLLGFKVGLPNVLAYMQATAIKIANYFGDSLTKNLKKTAKDVPSYFASAWTEIVAIFSVAPTYFTLTFTAAYNSTTTPFKNMHTWFHNKWDETKAVFKDVQSYFKSGFTNAYKAITSSFSGLSSFFRGIANDIIDPIGDAINGVAKGMNWILDELGSSKTIGTWKIPKFASGSRGVPRDTVGVVNDQPGSTYRELIVPPSGNAFIPTGRNVMLPLEKGTKIMPAGQTKSLLNRTPHFAKGIGNFFGNAWESAIGYTGNPMDYFDNPGKLVQTAFDKFIDTSRWTGAIGNVGVGVINTIFDSAVAFIKKTFGSNKIEQAVRWAIGIANDNSHGYDQAHRTGPDYDCSSLVTIALQKAGFGVNVGTTFTMLGQLISAGFKDVTNSVGLGSGSGMKRGDVLLNPKRHTAMYVGDGKIVHARINEFGGVTGGKTGDQTGNEIAVTPYHNHPWTYVLRYAKAYKNGIGRINLSDLIPAYSVGGFPEDGLFFANHNELIGQFSNGQTAVANNSDIQKGIEEAAYRGFVRASAENTRETSLLEELIDAVREGKQIVVDGRELVTAYDRRKSRNGFSFT